MTYSAQAGAVRTRASSTITDEGGPGGVDPAGTPYDTNIGLTKALPIQDTVPVVAAPAGRPAPSSQRRHPHPAQSVLRMGYRAPSSQPDRIPQSTSRPVSRGPLPIVRRGRCRQHHRRWIAAGSGQQGCTGCTIRGLALRGRASITGASCDMAFSRFTTNHASGTMWDNIARLLSVGGLAAFPYPYAPHLNYRD